jgi:hypothetical protein
VHCAAQRSYTESQWSEHASNDDFGAGLTTAGAAAGGVSAQATTLAKLASTRAGKRRFTAYLPNFSHVTLIESVHVQI